MKPEVETAIVEHILASKAGREVSPGAALSAVRWALARHTPKDAEKAAKARLHQLYGSWVAEGWARSADKTLGRLERGEADVLSAAHELLGLHASTRERLPHIEECYNRIFSVCGRPDAVLDAACGLNPLSFALLGMQGVSLAAADAGVTVSEVLNRFFALAGMANAHAEAGDILGALPGGQYDLALVMKFLPLAERMEKGGAVKLLDAINARHVAVSFPTRSLSGRNVGMEKNYSEWFEGLEFAGEIKERFLCGEEVFYIVGR